MFTILGQTYMGELPKTCWICKRRFYDEDAFEPRNQIILYAKRIERAACYLHNPSFDAIGDLDLNSISIKLLINCFYEAIDYAIVETEIHKTEESLLMALHLLDPKIKCKIENHVAEGKKYLYGLKLILDHTKYNTFEPSVLMKAIKAFNITRIIKGE